jgi:Carboxypeptidase regulatory-like domain
MTGKKNACSRLKLLQADFATFAIAAIRAAQSLLVMPRISAHPLSTANKIWRWRARMAGVLLMLGVPLLATAQQATVVGTVTDPSSAIVVGVQITLTNVDTSLSKTTATNADGQYVVPNLQIGHYAIKAEAKGFKVAEQKGIVLEVGDRRRVDFHLELGAAAETITVESTLPVAVQTDSNEISDVITGSQLAQLGTNGRSFYSLAKLVPGASSSQVDFQNPTPMGGDSNISFNGNRSMHALYMIDGGETDDRGGAQGSIVIPSQDSLAEFRVMTSNYSAE